MSKINKKSSSNHLKNNNDRNEEVEMINKGLKAIGSKIIVLSGGKGVGKTFTAQKFANAMGFKIKEINLHDLHNEIKQNNKTYKNIGPVDGIKYFLYSSKNILLTKTFWFSLMFSFPSLFFSISNLLSSLNTNLIYIWIFLLVAGSIISLFIIILLISWFYWKNCNENNDKNFDIRKKKNRVVLFTDNNMNLNEPLDLISILLKFYSKCRNTILILETSRNDVYLTELINKLNGHIINIKSNEQLNNDICNKYINGDLIKLNTFWDFKNNPKFSFPADYENRRYLLIDTNSDSGNVEWSITFFDYNLKKIIKDICGSISNREMLEIENKYNEYENTNNLNFIDFLVVQIAKNKDIDLLNSLLTKNSNFYNIKDENNKYIHWSTIYGNNIYETSNNMLFKDENDHLNNWIIERMYSLHKSKYSHYKQDTTLMREKELLSFDNIKDFLI